MSLFTRYFTVLLLSRFVIFSVGIIALSAALEFLAKGDEIVEATDGNVLEMAAYIGYGMADTFSRLATFIALISALVALITLMRRTELTIMISSGMSQWQLLRAMAPAALIITGFHFLIDNTVLPWSMSSLRDWAIVDYTLEKKGESSIIWTRDGTDIIRIKKIDEASGALENITLFLRTPDGALTERLVGARGHFENGRLILEDVIRTQVDIVKPERLDRYENDTSLDMTTLMALTAPPRELGWAHARLLASQPALGNRPFFLYRLWLNKRVAAPIGTLAVIILVIPLVQRFDRRVNHIVTLLIGIGVGAFYVVFDGFVTSLGEAGILPPLLAAWMSTFILIFLIGMAIFHRELIGARRVVHEGRITE